MGSYIWRRLSLRISTSFCFPNILSQGLLFHYFSAELVGLSLGVPHLRLFMCDLFNDALSSSDYTTSIQERCLHAGVKEDKKREKKNRIINIVCLWFILRRYFNN
jgi:hypothetical protein